MSQRPPVALDAAPQPAAAARADARPSAPHDARSGAPGAPDAHAGASPDFAALLRTCIHCGLCLSACPTYLATGDEAESPRGRLMLMADVLAAAEVPAALGGVPGRLHDRRPLDRCMGCRNCETVCPSGVAYGHLLEQTRSRLGPPPRGRERLVAWMVDHVLAHPRRAWLMCALGQWMARGALRAAAPPALRELLAALPARAAVYPARPSLPAHGDVALLAGCAQRVFTPEVLPATARLVQACGGVPYIPRGQVCCGALSQHVGSAGVARAFARRNVDAMSAAPLIVVPSAGCSAHMRAYGELLRDDPDYAERAATVGQRTVDLVEWLAQRVDRLPLSPSAARVVYHPPCHHTHAQRIVDAPLRLLRAVPQLTVVPLRDAERCCGSAGSYNASQPVLARAARAEKLDAIVEAAPEVLLSANPGCELFLLQGLRERGLDLPVRHLAVFLADHLEHPATR